MPVLPQFPFPMFSLLLPDCSGAVFLRTSTEKFLPLFTSRENAELFLERTKWPAVPFEISNKELLYAFIMSPPSKTPQNPTKEFRVNVDPTDKNDEYLLVFNREELLEELGEQIRQEKNRPTL